MSVISDGGQRQPDEKPDLLYAQLAAGSPGLVALSVFIYTVQWRELCWEPPTES